MTCDRPLRRLSFREPRAYLWRQDHPQQQAKAKRADQNPLARAGSSNLAPGPPVEVPGCQPRRLDEVPEDMKSHDPEPKDEGGLVEQQHLVPYAGWSE